MKYTDASIKEKTLLTYYVDLMIDCLAHLTQEMAHDKIMYLYVYYTSVHVNVVS